MNFFLKHKIVLHILYWLLAVLFFSLFFWPSHQYPIFTLFLLGLILPQTISVTYTINYILIPKLLMRKRYWLFSYVLVWLIIFSVWINLLSLALLLIQTKLSVVPTLRDFMVLLAGNYIIIFFAVIVHLVFRSFKEQLEKQQLEKQRIETELKLNQAQNELLKSQIHPHFLFNALNNLYGLCLTKSDLACTTVLKISELLDHMLYRCNQDSVSLNSEIAFLDNYIGLEKLRADDRLNVHFEKNINEQKIQIPPLLLFPFIENAFKHSARHNNGIRTIEIELKTKQNRLNLEVKNNYVASSDNSSSSGFGLANVKKRLCLYFKDEYKLEIKEANGLFSVQLELPVNRNDNESEI